MATTPKTTPATPVWPYPDIVRMTAHSGTGQWRKRHQGRDFYFGPIDDPDAALARWREEWPRILDGRDRKATPGGGGSETLLDLCQEFLIAKKAQHVRGELAWPSFVDYRYVCKKITDGIGRKRTLASVGPADFDRLLVSLSHLSPIKRQNTIIKVRSVFKWAHDRRLVSKPIEFGPDFRPPSAKVRRKAKREAGPRHLDAADVRLAVASASDPQMRALLLLAINGGYGNSDAAELVWRHVKDGWIDQPRAKNESERLVPLWPETLAVLNRLPRTDGRLFRDEKGRPLVRRGTNAVVDMTRELFDAIGLTDRGFYDLRRTFATVAAETGDEHAAKIIMGHVIDGVHEGYIQEFPEHRLLRVSNHVRAWFYDVKASHQGRSPQRATRDAFAAAKARPGSHPSSGSKP